LILVANDVVIVTVRGRLHGQRVVNTFWYRLETGTLPFDVSTELAATALEFRSLWQTTALSVLSHEYKVDAYRIQGLKRNLTGPWSRSTFYDRSTDGDVGADGGNSLPSTVSAVFKRLTELAGRSHRGRIFIAGVPSSSELDSIINPTGFGAWASAAEIVKLPLVSFDHWTLVPILKPRTFTAPVQDIIGSSCDPVLRVQRRREVGHGE